MSRGALVLLLIISLPSAADDHFILRPAGPLTDEARADLASRGVIVERALAGGAYLVRAHERTPLVGLEPFTAEMKIDRSARLAAAGSGSLVHVDIVFHDEVTLEEARGAIAAAGAELEDPFVLRFGYMHQLRARVPRFSVAKLAHDPRVFVIAGARRLGIDHDNATSAAMSAVGEVHQPPYTLSGEGVVVSQFELGAAWAAHPEFEGRLTVHGAASSSGHTTHVAGTIIAAGLSPYAKGMAPGATLHQFPLRTENEDWLIDKDEQLLPLGVVADNNSWSYTVGWSYGLGGYTWNGEEELWGAYDLLRTAAIDRIARERNVLFVHSAGNDAAVPAPGDWVHHRHLTGGIPDFEKSWCYSRNGTGRDCPQPQCSSGMQYCETTKHHPLSPFDTMSMTASAKNAVAVGSVDDDKQIAASSSRGPAKDGRVKPDLVARGVFVYSTRPGTGYTHASGTSMAAPVVTGTAALLTEEWRRSRGGNPGAAVLKALLITGAEDLGHAGPDYTYGFGLVNARASADLIRSRDSIRMTGLRQGERFEIPLVLESPGDVRVVLQWLDPEITLTGADSVAASALVNDLDLMVVDPEGQPLLPWVLDPTKPDAPATRGVNTVDNTEVVELFAAAPGTYRVIVNAARIADHSPQQMVIVSTRAFESQPAMPRRRAVRK